MDAASFYRVPNPQLCQGDIFEFLPHIVQKEQPQSLRKIALSKDKFVFELDELPAGKFPTTPETGTFVLATCHVCRAVLLTHDCEIDKDKKHRTVAMIRLLPKEISEKDRATIQQNQRFPFFYLPTHTGFPESYIDFRRISTVAPEWVDAMKRIASLSSEAKQAMLVQFFRFLTRVELDPGVFREKR